MKYAIQAQNKETKEWETVESGNAKSRRAYLKKFDRLSVVKKQWRCTTIESE